MSPKNTVFSSNYASPLKDHFLNSICLDLRSIQTIFLEMYQLLCSTLVISKIAVVDIDLRTLCEGFRVSR